jgi:hypothetical protein
MSYECQNSYSNIYYNRYIRVKKGVEKRDGREKERSKRGTVEKRIIEKRDDREKKRSRKRKSRKERLEQERRQ